MSVDEPPLGRLQQGVSLIAPDQGGVVILVQPVNCLHLIDSEIDCPKCHILSLEGST